MGGKSQPAPAPVEAPKPPAPIPDVKANAQSTPGETASSFASQVATDEESKAKQGLGSTQPQTRRPRRDPATAAATSQSGGTMGSSAVITG